MPNAGRPSRSCHLCRTRRVKCDLQRPSCRRCAVYGVACPGYREETQLIFRNKSQNSVGQAYQAKAAAPRITVERLGKFTFVNGPPQGAARVSFYPVLKSLPGPALSAKSVQVIQDTFYLDQNGKTSLTTGVFLLGLLTETDTNRSLVLATEAFARARVVGVGDETSSIHSKALAAIQAALAVPDALVSDAVVAAIWILTLFELLAGAPQLSPVPMSGGAETHLNGLETLLYLRGPDQYATPRGRQIFWTVQWHLLLRYVVTATACPDKIVNFLDNFSDISPPESAIPPRLPDLILARYIAEVGRVNTAISVDVRDGTAACEESYLQHVAAIEAADKIVLNAIDIPTPAETMATRFPWAAYRAVRLIMHWEAVHLANSVIAAMTRRGDPHWPVDLEAVYQQRRNSLSIMRQMGQEILDSVPPVITSLALRDQDPARPGPTVPWSYAFRLVFPVKTVALMDALGLERRLLARKILIVISSNGGVKEAVKRRVLSRSWPKYACWFGDDEPMPAEVVADVSDYKQTIMLRDRVLDSLTGSAGTSSK